MQSLFFWLFDGNLQCNPESFNAIYVLLYKILYRSYTRNFSTVIQDKNNS
jgi:hypothetical protein